MVAQGVGVVSALVTTFVSTLVGVVVGGIITWICAKLYYERSSQELRQEAERLRSHLQIILFGLHDAEVIDLTWNTETNLPAAIRLRNKRLPAMVDNNPSDASQESRESRETAAQDEKRADTPTASTSPQTGTQRRSWWRRMFGE